MLCIERFHDNIIKVKVETSAIDVKARQIDTEHVHVVYQEAQHCTIFPPKSLITLPYLNVPYNNCGHTQSSSFPYLIERSVLVLKIKHVLDSIYALLSCHKSTQTTH